MVSQAGFLLSKMTYSEKLKDPRWQRVRLETMGRDDWKCCKCGTDRAFLNVHHVNYDKGAEPWAYPLTNFITLCAPCHEAVEMEIRSARVAIVDAFRRTKKPKKGAKSKPVKDDPSMQPCTREQARAHFAELKRRLGM